MTTYAEIARLWATQAPKGPRKAGTFRREDRKAIHWGTVIGRIVDGPRGPVALVLNSHWGTATAAFINCCHAEAKKAGMPAFKVPERTADEKAHAANLAYYEAQAIDCETRIARARSVDWQAAADRWRETARQYQETFNLTDEFKEAAE